MCYSLTGNDRCFHVLYLVFTVAEAKCGIVGPENNTFFEDNNSASENEDVVETFPKPSINVQDFSNSAFPSPESFLKPFKSLTGLGLTKVSWFFVCLVLVLLFRTLPTAYGCSQARGQVGSVGASLWQSHTIPDPSCVCDLHHNSWQFGILNSLGEAKIERASSWILVRFITAEPQWEFLFGFLLFSSTLLFHISSP